MTHDLVAFPSDPDQILERIDALDPVRYASSRNYLTGAVSRLSPYISRGVISTRMVLERLLKKGYRPAQMEKFVQELCWRDYFQRVQQHFPGLHAASIRKEQSGSRNGVPIRLMEAHTGIHAIDAGVQELYATGYMHNHLRMYTAMLACNIANCHWRLPAQWMNYHLLDADVASNFCSWQWVAGDFSSKKYFANQENIDRYTGTRQPDSYLHVSYEDFPLSDIPESLHHTGIPALTTSLPEAAPLKLADALPIRLYTIYNLDPWWRKAEPANNILILEPSHFRQFPLSGKTMDFVLSLSKNIPGIQLYTQEFSELKKEAGDRAIIFKEHPLFRHFSGSMDQRDWIAGEVDQFVPGFFGYWKKVEKSILRYHGN
jgi:deoxyribodipyrimidine photo-lyase